MKLFDSNLMNVFEDSQHEKNMESAYNKTAYTRVEWESRIPCGDYEKVMGTYDQLLERVIAAGYDRMPTPKEVFSLHADVLEKNVSTEIKNLSNSINLGFGESFSVAVKRYVNELWVFENVRELHYDCGNDCYELNPGEWFDERKYFFIGDLEGGWNAIWDVNSVNPELIKYLYGRNYDELPKQMQSCSINLPPDDNLYVMSQADNGFGIGIWAKSSGRGVRPK